MVYSFRHSTTDRRGDVNYYCVIPSDPDALIDRLDLLLASKEAGNTRVSEMK